MLSSGQALHHDVKHADATDDDDGADDGADGDDGAGDAADHDDGNDGVFAGRCYVQARSAVLRRSDRLNLGYFSSLLTQDVESKNCSHQKLGLQKKTFPFPKKALLNFVCFFVKKIISRFVALETS